MPLPVVYLYGLCFYRLLVACFTCLPISIYPILFLKMLFQWLKIKLNICFTSGILTGQWLQSSRVWSVSVLILSLYITQYNVAYLSAVSFSDSACWAESQSVWYYNLYYNINVHILRVRWFLLHFLFCHFARH